MRAAVLADQEYYEKKLRVANHQSICGCNLQLEIHRNKVHLVHISVTVCLSVCHFVCPCVTQSVCPCVTLSVNLSNYSELQIEELREMVESLNSENVKLLTALQKEQVKVCGLERGVGVDTETQTKRKELCSVATITDNVTLQVLVLQTTSLFFNVFYLCN